MPKFTFEITDTQREHMNRHPEVNWSALFRATLDRHVRVQDIARQIEEEMDDPDIKELSELVKQGIGRRFRADLDARRG